MGRPETLLLSGKDVAELLTLSECIVAVEEGFRLLGEGKLPPPEILGLQGEQGGLHVKAAIFQNRRSYFVAKANANFPGNPKQGLPTVQGVVLVYDASNGIPLAVMDSIEITILRTGAATAVAAKYLARQDSKVATIAGCGVQGRVQLLSLLEVLKLESAFVYDTDFSAAERLAKDSWKIPVTPVRDFGEALRRSDACVTCTTAKNFFVKAAEVRPGTFIAGVGADSDQKQEIDPELFVKSKVVVDSLAQCAKIGDVHHAVDAGKITPDKVHAELAEVVAGTKPGRKSPDEVCIFDSTGIAVEDAVSAVRVYERARASGKGTRFSF